MIIGDFVFLNSGFYKNKKCYILGKVSFFLFKTYILDLKEIKLVSVSKLKYY